MTLAKALSFSLSLASCLCVVDGCTTTTTSDPQPVEVVPGPGSTVSDGTLIVDWTISGTKDPAQCQQGGAPSISIVVSGSGGGEFRQDCGAFATSITLPPGSYTANAVLLDASGDERTTEVQLDPFTIHGDDQLTMPIDFPADSFR